MTTQTSILISNTQRLVSVLVLGVLGVIPPLQAQTHAADYAVNQRQPVQVTPVEHAHLLTEMNAFMQAIHNIQTALVAKDMELVAKIATTMGPKKGGHDAVGKAVHDKLPPEWFALAKPTHQNFLAIAKAAQQPASVEAVLGAVAKTTAQCVSCHASYRLAIAP
ncbi:MAG: hypothetical protein RJB14_1508 [Pseudomonadota bacterium]